MIQPLAYIVVSLRDDGVMGSGPTLREAVRGLERPDYGFGWRVEALVGTERVAVPKEAYAEPDLPTRDEALAFIRYRAAMIAASPDPAMSIYRSSGCMRCNCDDPEDKQVEDYIRTAAWRLRAEPDEDWWRATSAGDENGTTGDDV